MLGQVLDLVCGCQVRVSRHQGGRLGRAALFASLGSAAVLQSFSTAGAATSHCNRRVWLRHATLVAVLGDVAELMLLLRMRLLQVHVLHVLRIVLLLLR